MARAADEGSDLVIITSDNPRTEDPQKIIDDASGIHDFKDLPIDDKIFSIGAAVIIPIISICICTTLAYLHVLHYRKKKGSEGKTEKVDATKTATLA